MATKKKVPVKAAKPAKKAAKPAPKKPVARKAEPAKPAKKAVVAKPAKKAAKPVAHKPVKPAAKKIAKVQEKSAGKAKPVVKKAVKTVKTPVPAKKAIPAKPVTKSNEVIKTEPVKATVKPAEIRRVVKPVEEKKPAKPVVMPKINATTSRKYEPEFTKSVLDQPVHEQTGPTMRYSDAELQEFKELISRKLDAAKKELSYLHGLITRKDEMSGDETDNRYMTMEDGSLSMEREQLSQMASRQIDFIDKLEKALVRIENKTYGICRVTGKLIDKARLRAVPHATLSIEAKMGMAKNPNMQ
jgi:RNA polymerase-binding transcription factor DksA